MSDEEDDVYAAVKAAYDEVASKGDEDGVDKSTASEIDAGEDKDASVDAEQKVSGRQAPPKDERGRFAKRTVDAKSEKSDGAGVEDDGKPDQRTPQDAKKGSAGSVAPSPPPGWSVKSKASWDELPQHVRADIAKRETEMNDGLAALRDYKDLKPFAEMATKYGTTIKDALQRYVGIEQLMQRDLGAGLAQVLENFGMSQQQAGQFFATLAQRYGGVSAGGGNTQAKADPLQDILKPFIDPLKQEVTSLRSQLSSRQQADQNASSQSLASAIETFSVDPGNRYFADLEETITRLFETGMVKLTGNHENDLKTAYDMAAQIVPEVREALINQRLRDQKDAARQKEQEAADKAKKASRSLTGSRTMGTTYSSPGKPNGQSDDLEDVVRAAYHLHAQQ